MRSQIFSSKCQFNIKKNKEFYFEIFLVDNKAKIDDLIKIAFK